MNYTLHSTKYVLKNFVYLLPFAIIPAIFLAFSTDERAMVFVLDNFLLGNIAAWDFVMLFRAVSIFNFVSWQSIAFGLIGIVATVLCSALMLALIEKHMRIGKRTFNGVFSKLNDNLMPTTGYALFLLVIYEIWALITAALLYVSSLIPVAVIAYTLACIVFIGMHFVLLYAINVVYLWLPCMQITGFKATEALYYTYKLASPARWKLMFAQTLSLFMMYALLYVCILFAPAFTVFPVLTTALYTALIMVFCVRMMIAYFHLDHIERADIKPYYEK